MVAARRRRRIAAAACMLQTTIRKHDELDVGGPGIEDRLELVRAGPGRAGRGRAGN